MQSIENRLFLWGGAAVAFSGLFWVTPAINAIAALSGIVGLILIIARLGFARGLSIATIGFTLALMICSLTIGYQAGFLNALLYAAVVLAPGFAMGWASRNMLSPLSTVQYGIIPLAIILVFFLFTFSSWIRGLPLVVDEVNMEIETVLEENPELASLIANRYAPAEGSTDRFLKEVDDMLEIVIKIIPGTLALAFLGMVVFGLFAAGSISSRLGIMLPRFQPFHRWRASGWWLLPTILGLIPVVFVKDDFWFFLGVNILLVTGHVYSIVGLSIIEAFFKRFYVPTPMRVIFYILLLFASLLSLVFLAVLGLSDTKLNFKREANEIEDKKEE